MGSYVPSTIKERQQMLEAIGCSSFEDLFSHIPEKVRLNNPLGIPEGLSEMEVRTAMEEMAHKNTVFKTIFRGAGAYNHYIPSVVKHITSKEEFVTAYTPYQAEMSQGLLQAIFEFQTMVCELTGMAAANASVYDGATAAAEAIMMCKERGKNSALVSETTHPQTLAVIATYCKAIGVEVQLVPVKEGLTDLEALKTLLNKNTACVYIQQPNYYGLIEDADGIGELAHQSDAKYIMGCNPISLAVLKTPSECGADIAVGEGQPLGLPLSFGGPYLGFMTCTASMTRKLPGRIVGETTDLEGKRAFVLTLQAREQHIRREKASSNICSNQALCALTASVYMSAMGPRGLEQVASQCLSKAAYAAGAICSVAGYELKFKGAYFNEFVTNCPVSPDQLMAELEKKGILGGCPLSGDLEGCILWCFTEVNTKAEIDGLVTILREVKA
ncbi:MAG: aminomethyl-transferring glycine dehydrogenase subunit GcvPA [Vallitaleaceae bacterium]|nr:aminomethyl-transferring glycine dehydrogenase subunit GcvPA [Vallitaleaceae bacterium]